MTAARKRARARRIVALCALAALPVALVGIPGGIRSVRESLAIRALQSPNRADREAALRELDGLRSVRAVPEILSSMATKARTDRACQAVRWSTDASGDGPWEALCARTIREIGAPAVPLLRSKLGSGISAERFWSLFLLLSVFGIARPEPDPALFSFLDDADEDIRYIAAIAIGVSAAKDHRVLGKLVCALQGTSASDDHREAAARAIWEAAEPDGSWLLAVRGAAQPDGVTRSPEMIEGMRSAARALRIAAEDPSESVRSMSLNAVWAILRDWFPEDIALEREFEGVIRRGLEDEDASMRSIALLWIEEAFREEDGTLPRDVLEILGTLLQDDSADVSALAENHLTVHAVPVLLDLIDRNTEPHPRVREVLDSMAQNAWTVLFDHLLKPDGSVREIALELLVSAGAPEGVGIDLLIGALASRNPRLRRAAARVLARYHASRSVETHVLFPLLFDDDEEVRSHVAAALSSSGSLPLEVFQGRVLHLLEDSKPVPVRRAACGAAAGLRARAIQAVPALTAAAGGDPPELAAEAIEALAAVSPEESFPVFVRALAHEDPRVRDAAVTALGPAAGALPAFHRITRLLRRQDVEKPPPAASP